MKIVSAIPHDCSGRGIIRIDIPEDLDTLTPEHHFSKTVDGKEVCIKPDKVHVQHKEDGSTRVLCPHLSNGEGNPEQVGHCLKIQESIDDIRIFCNRALTGSLVQNHGSKTGTETIPCKWIIQPIDAPKDPGDDEKK